MNYLYVTNEMQLFRYLYY